MKLRLDKLGVVVALLAVYAAFFAPLMIFRPNRIVPGQGKSLWESQPPSTSIAFVVVIGVAILITLFKTPLYLRLSAAAAVLAGLAISVGSAASFLTPDGNTYARVSPASGAWLLMLAFALLAADAIARLRPTPVVRIALLAVSLAGIAVVLSSGLWDGLSIIREYAGRADVFWQEAGKHVTLAIGSLIAAVVVGLPLGVLAHRVTSLRAGILNTLNFVQTIPSIALFGILIAPLGWIAINVPGAAAIGIRGIGAAPAFVALFLYSLLPVVANTVVGLEGVPREANEAARGVGMTGRQRLFGIELPLAMPVILTGIRIVLVQNIGLATIAALIGGGGFGVFVFQGVGQTAMDLVLLGAVPTVVLAFTAATVLDALVELNAPVGTRGKAA
ncbi:ABC transporter permease [Rhizobium sp. Leaf321]|uniref:ABC transporter permease n=1 Tax=Rhizobium sp. Leaf321 TaxID=1736335 RepID=UPI000714C5AB|nr:ABC transporter permease [Rhizobium sp. Leaf321]KQQ75068.1 ABC transporter permease [Rhizobium sp. Leaf321]